MGVHLAGAVIPVAADGSFSLDVSLHPGLNSFLFQGRAYNLLEGVAKLDLYLDGQGPAVNITAPVANHHTNAATIHIHGIVEDAYDSAPVLTRDGSAVPLENGRFTERDLTLQNGINQFTYAATDAAGNQGAPVTLTVHRSDSPPSLQLDAPDHIAKGESYTIDLQVTPAAEIEAVSVTVANQQVFEGTDGAPYSAGFTQEGNGREITVHASARDRYGNLAETGFGCPGPAREPNRAGFRHYPVRVHA